MVDKIIKQSPIFGEFTPEEANRYFSLSKEKVTAHVDTFYYSVSVYNDSNECSENMQALLNQLSGLKVQKASNDSAPIEFFGLNVEKTRFVHYEYCLRLDEQFDIFISSFLPNDDTPRIVVQLRSRMLVLDGVCKAICKSFRYVEDILFAFGLEADEVKENRIDYAYHTNLVQNPYKYFNYMCTFCGYTEQVEDAHTFENGECKFCPYQCFSHNYVNGYCEYCGMAECTHTSTETYYEYVIGDDRDIYHDLVRACTDCGKVLSTVSTTEHNYDGSTCTICEYTIEKYSFDYVNCLNSVTGGQTFTFATVLKNSTIAANPVVTTLEDGTISVSGWSAFSFGVDHYNIYAYDSSLNNIGVYRTDTPEDGFTYDLSSLRSDHESYLTNDMGLSFYGDYQTNGMWSFNFDFSDYPGEEIHLIIFAVPKAGSSLIEIAQVGNITVYGEKETEVLYGDINADGILDKNDLLKMSDLIYSNTYSAIADLNEDSVVDISDMVVLKKYFDDNNISYDDTETDTSDESASEGESESESTKSNLKFSDLKFNFMPIVLVVGLAAGVLALYQSLNNKTKKKR